MEEYSQIHAIDFGLLSSNEIREHAVCEITLSKMSGPNTVYDERMGVIEPGKRCQTCQGNNLECPGHFGMIQLIVPVMHPLYLRLIVSLLRVVCWDCGAALVAPEELVLKGIDKFRGHSRFEKIAKVAEGKGKCRECGAIHRRVVMSEGRILLLLQREDHSGGRRA